MSHEWLLTPEELDNVNLLIDVAVCCAQHRKTLEWMDDQMATTFTRLGNEVVAMRRGQWELLLAQARKDIEI